MHRLLEGGEEHIMSRGGDRSVLNISWSWRRRRGSVLLFFIKTSCKYTVFIDDVSLFEDETLMISALHSSSFVYIFVYLYVCTNLRIRNRGSATGNVI